MEGITPYIWLIAGASLIIVEFFAPVMISFFFGVSAALVAMLLFIGLDLSVAQQVTIFSVLSVASLVIGRKYCKSWFKGNMSDSQASDITNFKKDIGDHVEVTSEFKNGVGRVKLNGVEWNAKLESKEVVEVGEMLEVVNNEGIQLIVKKPQ